MVQGMPDIIGSATACWNAINFEWYQIDLNKTEYFHNAMKAFSLHFMQIIMTCIYSFVKTDCLFFLREDAARFLHFCGTAKIWVSILCFKIKSYNNFDYTSHKRGFWEPNWRFNWAIREGSPNYRVHRSKSKNLI